MIYWKQCSVSMHVNAKPMLDWIYTVLEMCGVPYALSLRASKGFSAYAYRYVWSPKMNAHNSDHSCMCCGANYKVKCSCEWLLTVSPRCQMNNDWAHIISLHACTVRPLREELCILLCLPGCLKENVHSVYVHTVCASMYTNSSRRWQG